MQDFQKMVFYIQRRNHSKNKNDCMKQRNLFFCLAGMIMLAMAFSSCGKGYCDDENGTIAEFDADPSGYGSGGSKDGGSGTSDGSGDGIGLGATDASDDGNDDNGNTQAGVVTAGEWSDLTHWMFWSKLMLGSDYKEMCDYWQFYTNNRIALRVTDGAGNPVAGVNVKLLRRDATLWQAVTDNHGLAECWIGLSQKETATAQDLRISLNDQVMTEQPVVSNWDAQQEHVVNEYVFNKKVSVKQQADIAFIVDATGSMTDEINFLKSDLDDIIGKVALLRPAITMRTAALFYRDTNDEYLTRYSDFTQKLNDTRTFIGKQRADGGGDYPEAVHTALERSLQDLSWDEGARTRLAFMLLDAPAHHEDDVIKSLQQSIALMARQGIKLIPIAASGVDKNTEFMLRFFAISTGGTYVFLTNHSGVGGEHIEASVGEYKVEQLNSLIVRLIDYYTE
jgi:hypothetical protein